MSKKKWSKLTDRERQEKIGQVVGREIYVCQSMLVDELLKREVLSYDDLINAFVKWEYAGHGKCENEECKSGTTEDLNEYDLCKECYEDNEETQEIYEWWVVSNWLAKRLEDEGQPILDTDWGKWWGRCATGQAIKLDWVIEKIVKELYG